MGKRVALALTLAAAAAACSSPDYGHARETRFERTYRGGAASVPDEPDAPRTPAAAAAERPSAIEILGFFGALGLLFSHGVDPTAPSNRGLQRVDAPSR